jgi:hypothetical protein
MDSDQPDSDKERPLDHPVKIITAEDMAEYYEEMRLKSPTSNTGFVSPLSDESVQGYPSDRLPRKEGVEEILGVVKMLENAGASCCMVAEPALIYYGTGRVKTVCSQNRILEPEHLCLTAC